MPSRAVSTRLLGLLLTAVAAVALAACSVGDGGDPEDFAKFADEVAEAAERGDAAFFTERIQGQPRTCTAEEVEISTGPDAPPNPICTEPGLQFEAVHITTYGAAGAVTVPEDVQRDIEKFFSDSLAGEEDRYGTGAVRLYATGKPLLSADTEVLQSAVLTAIIEFNNRPGRFVLGLDFEFVEGRWVIRGETVAGVPIAVDLLEPNTAGLVYDQWEPY